MAPILLEFISIYITLSLFPTGYRKSPLHQKEALVISWRKYKLMIIIEKGFIRFLEVFLKCNILNRQCENIIILNLFIYES